MIFSKITKILRNDRKSKVVKLFSFAEKRLLNESSEKDHILMAHVSSRLVSPENAFRLEATIIGPASCPFENGVFVVSVDIPATFPFKPPVIKFKTKIFHPNINERGEISIDILGPQWSAVLTIDLVLLAICSVLSDPVEPFVTGNPAVILYRNDRKAYEKKAREWTIKYAKA